MPIEPTQPANSGGTGSGRRVSPRCEMKMRSGDSANTPELPPNAKPSLANGLCQPSTTSYGLGPMGPASSCAAADPLKKPTSSNATAEVK